MGITVTRIKVGNESENNTQEADLIMDGHTQSRTQTHTDTVTDKHRRKNADLGRNYAFQKCTRSWVVRYCDGRAINRIEMPQSIYSYIL